MNKTPRRICRIPDQNVTGGSGPCIDWGPLAQRWNRPSISISRRTACSAESVLAFSLTSGKHSDKYLPKWVGSCAWMTLRNAAEGPLILLTQTLWVTLLKIIGRKTQEPLPLLGCDRNQAACKYTQTIAGAEVCAWPHARAALEKTAGRLSQRDLNETTFQRCESAWH